MKNPQYQTGQAISWLSIYRGCITKFFGHIKSMPGDCIIAAGKSRTGDFVVDRLSIDDKTIEIANDGKH